MSLHRVSSLSQSKTRTGYQSEIQQRQYLVDDYGSKCYVCSLKRSPADMLEVRAFCVTAAVNLRSLGESWTPLWRTEVKWPRGGRLLGRPPSPWRPFTAAGSGSWRTVRAHRATQRPCINHSPRKTMGPYGAHKHTHTHRLLPTTSRSHNTWRDVKLWWTSHSVQPPPEKSSGKNNIFCLFRFLFYLVQKR